MKKVVSLLLSVVILLSLSSCVSREGENEPSSDEFISNTVEPNLPPTDFFDTNETLLNPLLPNDVFPKLKEGIQKPSDSTELKNDDTSSKTEQDKTSISEHETTIPEPEIKENSNSEIIIDVSDENLKDLVSSYFESPEETIYAQKLYQKLKQMYLNCEWNGEPFNINEHVFSISSKGYICVDGLIFENHAEPLDLPNQSRYYNNVGLIDDCNIQYVAGKGSYILIDDIYMLYLRGERIPLEGEPLNWKEGEGVDVNYGHAILHYDRGCDKMFLTTPIVDDSSVNYVYLYIFPDYNVSKIEFVAKINGTFLYNNEENTVYYQDTDDAWWMYCEKEDGSYYFEKIS